VWPNQGLRLASAKPPQHTCTQPTVYPTTRWARSDVIEIVCGYLHLGSFSEWRSRSKVRPDPRDVKAELAAHL
jgi:hypothetical protein